MRDHHLTLMQPFEVGTPWETVFGKDHRARYINLLEREGKERGE